MNSNRTENGSDHTISLFAQHSLSAARRVQHSTSSFTRTLLHTRALLRMARSRRSLALGLCVAAGSAITSVAAIASVAVHQVQLHSSVRPLAPAPAPPAPPNEHPRHHRFLALSRINPLHGLASWYGDVWNGRKTASGETFDDTKLTAAHKTLPLGTIVRVTNLTSRRSVVVKINDRGTLAPHRVIDLSSAAARELGMVQQGLANVKLEVIGKS